MALVYLIPSLLHEEGLMTLPAYVIEAVKSCQVFFTENERTTRRYFKKLWPQMTIDQYEWIPIDEQSATTLKVKLKEDKTIGIVSEAGCPAVADPGQELVRLAQDLHVTVKPLVGPSSILLALMASGMNGQRFQFLGYLPVESHQRRKAILELEAASARKNCTQIFIETPYRNNQITAALLQTCKPETRLCIAVNLTGKDEWIKSMSIADWKKQIPDIHKRPAIFLVSAF